VIQNVQGINEGEQTTSGLLEVFRFRGEGHTKAASGHALAVRIDVGEHAEASCSGAQDEPPRVQRVNFERNLRKCAKYAKTTLQKAQVFPNATGRAVEAGYMTGTLV
jgi:hypothetical protein